jgi:hypothetical protein
VIFSSSSQLDRRIFNGEETCGRTGTRAVIYKRGAKKACESNLKYMQVREVIDITRLIKKLRCYSLPMRITSVVSPLEVGIVTAEK